LLYQTEGFLWIGTDKGLEYMRLPARQIEPTPFVDHIFPNTDDRVKTIFLDSKKYLWLGYYLDGLYRIDMKNHQSWHIKRDDYNQWETYYREINTIFEDTQNRIWIGTWDSGLHVHDPCMKPFHHFYHMPTNPNSINTNLIRGMFCDDRGIVWIGTNGGGLNRFDPQIKQFTHYKHSPQNSVNISKNIISCIFQDSAKKLWVGTQRGIGIYDPYSEKLLPLPAHMPFPDIFKNSNIYTIIEDGQSGLWYGSNNGLFHYQPLDKTVRLFQHQPDNQNSLTSNTIWDLLEDHQKMIWIATHSTGISHFDPKTDSFTHYRHQPNQPNSLSSNRVYVLCETQDHRLWIGTNRGLNLFNPTNQSFTHYTVSQGLPNNKIYGIIEDNNHQLWLSTNNGLCRFDPDSLQVTNFFKEDGLQSNEFNDRAFAKDQNGRLYFGGINGFNVFDPAEIKKNPLIPTVILTGFQLFNKTIHPQDKVHGKILMHQSISITNKLTLSYQDKLISFSFVALNLTASSKNQYAYKMEGFDQDWNYCGTRRSAFYTNLPAGHYTFRVIACNNDGVWNETGAHIQLTVTPPFWQTWWFYSLLFLSILITLLFLHFYRVKTVILQERKKYELPAELIDEYSDQLINKMDSKKYYLQSTLTLNELAGYLSIPAYQLSHIINNKQNKNFNEFINEYRINEAKRILETSKDAKINILELAYQTGFNSKSVFNSSFKKFTGQTPSQFKRNNHPD
jgi:ligand-binding sensor domain-containing protein/AraC-like DNA-binding protein